MPLKNRGRIRFTTLGFVNSESLRVRNIFRCLFARTARNKSEACARVFEAVPVKWRTVLKLGVRMWHSLIRSHETSKRFTHTRLGHTRKQRKYFKPWSDTRNKIYCFRSLLFSFLSAKPLFRMYHAINYLFFSPISSL